MRFLGGISGEIELLSSNADEEASLVEIPWTRKIDSARNENGGINGTHSPASSTSSTTPKPLLDVENLRSIAAKLSLESERNESISTTDVPEQMHELPQPLRNVLIRIPHFNLTGKIKYSASIGNANGGSCDVFIGVVVEGHYVGTAKKFAVKRIRAHIHCDTNFTKVCKSAYIKSIRLMNFI